MEVDAELLSGVLDLRELYKGYVSIWKGKRGRRHIPTRMLN